MNIQNTYKYGITLDAEARPLVWDQIITSRRLYNEIIAKLREIYGELQDFTRAKAGAQAAEIMAEITRLNEDFKLAKAANDEPRMKTVADARRGQWQLLSPLLKKTRAEYKKEIQSQFLSRIGGNADQDTRMIANKPEYQQTLGFAQRTEVLNRALRAWKDSMKLGKPPLFAASADKTSDTLVLQFNGAGGLPLASLLSGKSKEINIAATKRHGEFYFRLGAAALNHYATGEITLHRPLPEGCTIPGARLVCERVANQEKYFLQLVVSHDLPIAKTTNRKPLLAVHFGWSFDEKGRRIAAINDTTDPSTAQLIQLPPDIEVDLERAYAVQSQRDEALLALHQQLKLWPMTGEDTLDAEIQAIQKLPHTHVSPSRLHRLIEQSWRMEVENQPAWLREWKSLDKKRWQAQVGIARRARERRANFYTELAKKWCSEYDAIVIEPLDLKAAGTKVDETTGEKSEFNRKARAGQRVAALYELESAIRWQAVKHGTAIFDETPETVKTCAHCGESGLKPLESDWQTLVCPHCGAETGRKENGATVLYQLTEAGIESRTIAYHEDVMHQETERLAKKAEKLRKMQQGRRERLVSARTASDG